MWAGWPGSESSTYTFRLTTVPGRLLPGIDLTDRDKLFDLLARRARLIAPDTNILVFAHRRGTRHHTEKHSTFGGN